MKKIVGESVVSGKLGLTINTENGGQCSVVFLSDTMARVTYQPKNGFKEPKTWAIAPLQNNELFADVAWSGRDRKSYDGFNLPKTVINGQCLSTAKITATINLDPLCISWHDSANQSLICSDRTSIAYMDDGRTGAIRHYMQRDFSERFYGLGDKTGKLDLHHRRLRASAMDSLAFHPINGDPLYKHWPFLLTRNPQGQWIGYYYDTMAPCTFDLGCEHDNYHGFYRYVEIDDGDLDYYVMFGATPAEVIAQWMTLIGGTHLPPKWSIGFAQTAMGLVDAPDAQNQLDQFIESIKTHQCPISSFHYGSGYSTRGKRRYVFTWNQSKFPDPKAINKKFHDHGMNIVVNIKPCLLDDHPAYKEVADFGGFINDDNNQPILEPYWDGQGSHLDFTNPKTVLWWQENLQKQVLEYGMDCSWNDNNEYCILDENANSAGFNQSMPIHRSRPLHALLMTRASFERQNKFAAQNPNLPDNGYTVTRAGLPGIQRYAQTWSGDNSTSWQSLRWNIRTGLQMSLSGMFNTGHDVGGFYGPLPTPELLVRWTQACCLNPRMVMNSWKEGGQVTVPWLYPEVTREVIAAIELRYQLIDYLWSLFQLAHSHHQPIIRPTFYDFYDDDQCFEDCDDFMLGAKILVAPVVEEDAVTREIYLPNISQGINGWVDYHTKETFKGGTRITVPAPLNTLPLFVKAGVSLID